MAEGATTPIGHYSPIGDSPYGVTDMAGNVWEWCSTKWVGNYRDYDKKAKDREGLEGDDPRVLRGGAFDLDEGGVRAACRFRDDPADGLGNYGFRVVAGAS